MLPYDAAIATAQASVAPAWPAEAAAVAYVHLSKVTQDRRMCD